MTLVLARWQPPASRPGPGRSRPWPERVREAPWRAGSTPPARSPDRPPITAKSSAMCVSPPSWPAWSRACWCWDRTRWPDVPWTAVGCAPGTPNGGRPVRGGAVTQLRPADHLSGL